MEIESFSQGCHNISKNCIFIEVPQVEQAPKEKKKIKRNVI